MSTPRPIDTATVRRISVVADADPRTVDRVLRGQPTRHMVRARIERAIAELGIETTRAPQEPQR